MLKVSIAGLHVTSRRPCWWPGTKAFLSSGSQTLFSCKFFEKKFYCIDPQHGRLVTWLHQVRWFIQVSHLFSRYQRPLFRLVLGGRTKYQGKEAQVCQQENHYFSYNSKRKILIDSLKGKRKHNSLRNSSFKTQELICNCWLRLNSMPWKSQTHALII